MNTQELANELHKEAVWSEFLPGSQAGLMIRASRELARLAEVNAGLVREMERYLPVIAKAEDSTVWSELTDGTGIATANGYRAALAAAKEQQ